MIAGLAQIAIGSFNTFSVLFAMRMLSGAMNSACTPLSFSLVTDYVRPERRATANSVLTAASYMGIAMSSLSILMIKKAGWRQAYITMGTAGVLIGFLALFFIIEPIRKISLRDKKEIVQHMHEIDKKKCAKEQFLQILKALTIGLEQKTSRYVIFAAVLRVVAGVASSYFLPVFFMKVFPGYRDQYAVANAAALAFCGLASSLVGGILSDTFEKKSYLSKSIVCMGSSFLALPFCLMSCFNQSSFWLSMAMVTCKTLVSAAFTSPAIAML